MEIQPELESWIRVQIGEPKIHVFEKASERPTLEAAQELVGGYVEMVTLSDKTQLLVNEDGRAFKLGPNVLANALSPGHDFLGPAIHLKGEARWE